MYKKKSLQFTHEKFSREVRHTESLKARESSRFKRLSTVRNINDSDIYDGKTMDSKNSVEWEESHNEKKQQSRLEMLFKFKQEKLLKKQLEMQLKKQPFYAGRNAATKSVPDNKVASTNLFLSNKVASNSKQVSLTKSLLSNKGPITSKQLTLGSICQPSKIPSSSKQASSGAKSFKPASKVCSIPSFQKKHVNAVSNPSALGINKNNSVPKVLKSNEKVPPVKSISNSITAAKLKGSLKPINQGSSQSKPSSHLPSKISQKVHTTIPKSACSTSNNKEVSKGIPIRSKMPVANIKQKCTTVSKLHQKETHSMENVTLRKGYCFKKAAKVFNEQKTGTIKKIPSQNAISVRQTDEKKKNVEIKCNKELVPKQNLERNPDLTFNSNISIIKPVSFAPVDFKFQTPSGLTDFIFDDEDDDPCNILREVTLKLMSRTSTPTKPAKRNSAPKDSSYNEEYLINTNKLSHELCNEDTNIVISDLISPEPSPKEKITINKEIDKCVNQVICGMATETETETSDRKCDESSRNIFDEKKLSEDSAKNENTEEDSDNVYSKIDNNESQPCVSVKNNTSEKNISLDDSFLDIDIDTIKNIIEEKIQLITLEDEEISKADSPKEPGTPKRIQRKAVGAIPKRTSMLKSVSTLNMIAETSETDLDCLETPRRSKRILTLQHHDILSDCEKKTVVDSPISSVHVTPRRSLRLQQKSEVKVESDEYPGVSPFNEKNSSAKRALRRSMRLIDLNTPEKDVNELRSKTNLTADFEKLRLNDSENKDPNLLLLDFESPELASKLKSKKVSLLYTPEKTRKSLRKSIRGDLISFSPSS